MGFADSLLLVKKIAGNFSETKFKTGEKQKKKLAVLKEIVLMEKGPYIVKWAKYVGEWKDGKIKRRNYGMVRWRLV